MELRQLEAFVCVAQENSFTRAAVRLHLTQPAVTRQIGALEAELGAELFERLGKSIRLSAAGEALLPHAETVLREATEAREAVSEAVAGRSGRLTLAASSTLASYLLPPVLAAFRQAHPGVELQLRTGLSAQVWAQVRSGDAQLGLATTEGTDEERRHDMLLVTPLGRYETIAVVPPRHPLAGNSSLALGTLAGEPLAMSEGTTLRAFLEGALERAGVVPRITLELDSVEAIKRMVEAGLGISLLPRIAVRAETEGGRLVALPLADLAQAERRMVFLRRRDRRVTPPQETLERLLSEAQSTLSLPT
ncbi:MAG: LysR substrate-binding domain-containing protein [Armatimonas sp.]